MTEQSDSVVLPEQQVPVIDRCDVLVVGGGAAGLSAAISAKRQGADVVLVERYGYLGGLASGGLVVLLLTLDDGAGHQVVAGLCQELVERLEAREACFSPPRSEWGETNDELIERYQRMGLVWGAAPHKVRYSVAYDPEEFKFVANTWIGEAEVRLLYHRWASDVVRDGDRITHVVFTSKAGRHAVACNSVIDATGDGDVFTLAGEPSELEEVHPWLWFRMAGIDDDDAIAQARGLRTIKPGQALMPWGAADRIERRIDALRERISGNGPLSGVRRCGYAHLAGERAGIEIEQRPDVGLAAESTDEAAVEVGPTADAVAVGIVLVRA